LFPSSSSLYRFYRKNKNIRSYVLASTLTPSSSSLFRLLSSASFSPDFPFLPPPSFHRLLEKGSSMIDTIGPGCVASASFPPPENSHRQSHPLFPILFPSFSSSVEDWNNEKGFTASSFPFFFFSCSRRNVASLPPFSPSRSSYDKVLVRAFRFLPVILFLPIRRYLSSLLFPLRRARKKRLTSAGSLFSRETHTLFFLFLLFPPQ